MKSKPNRRETPEIMDMSTDTTESSTDVNVDYSNIFKDSFYNKEYLSPEVLDEINKERNNPSVYISVISISCNQNGKFHQTKQIIRFSKTKKIHLREIHQIGKHQIIYTRDKQPNGKENNKINLVNLEKNEIEDFEENFKRKIAEIPNNVINPISFNNQSNNHNHSSNQKYPNKSRNHDPNHSIKQNEISDFNHDNSLNNNKLIDNSSQQNNENLNSRKSSKQQKNKSYIDQNSFPLNSYPSSNEITNEIVSNHEIFEKYKFHKLKHHPIMIPHSNKFVNKFIAIINEIRYNRHLLELKSNDFLMKEAQKLSEKLLIPEEADLVPKMFNELKVKNSFSCAMIAPSFHIENINPLDVLKQTIINSSTNKDYQNIFGNFTHIGIGVSNDCDSKWVFFILFSCLRPNSIRKVKSITYEESKFLTNLINNYRKDHHKKPLKYSSTISSRAMNYVKRLFIGEFEPESVAALDAVAEIVHDYPFSEFIGSIESKNYRNNEKSLKDIFQYLVDHYKNNLLSNDEKIGLSIVHDGIGHWMFLVSLEHIE
ncbi:hypothetical protein TRFO_02046 [Tritrichomonas foetus]|uniref:Uncharacterized protein n=1 Tax=Tritrichomonas foetus TaxID=1144522 RepID=A0A1J4JIA3_9EUKA|nr:hypothetical protein TRFO_02046 [Tritrichomonas foetus]|eukprot:OHS96924.1 hypothetical protein TRFO_02046 [Tritrichomonas foetus]